MDTHAQRLIAAARAGDPGAIEALIDLLYPPIYAFLRRLAGSEADAADLTQRTFSRVWTALPGFAGRSSVAGWFHGIARHVFLDWCRSRSRDRADPQTDAWWETCAATGPSPAETVSYSDLARTVFASVDRLEPDLRHAIHLHYYQGLTLDETATALGVATSTVKYRLRNAITQLQRNLASPPPQPASVPRCP